jgi:hypothetical protein
MSINFSCPNGFSGTISSNLTPATNTNLFDGTYNSFMGLQGNISSGIEGIYYILQDTSPGNGAILIQSIDNINNYTYNICVNSQTNVSVLAIGAGANGQDGGNGQVNYIGGAGGAGGVGGDYSYGNNSVSNNISINTNNNNNLNVSIDNNVVYNVLNYSNSTPTLIATTNSIYSYGFLCGPGHNGGAGGSTSYGTAGADSLFASGGSIYGSYGSFSSGGGSGAANQYNGGNGNTSLTPVPGLGGGGGGGGGGCMAGYSYYEESSGVYGWDTGGTTVYVPAGVPGIGGIGGNGGPGYVVLIYYTGSTGASFNPVTPSTTS